MAGLGQANRRDSDELAKYLATGECRKIENPFTGEEWHIGKTREIGALRKWIEAAGIEETGELETLLRDLLRHHGHGQLWHLFVGLDGGSGLEHEVDLELRVVEGEPLPDYMHELFSKHQ